jgi:quercetin 2,3-dioxygenase
MTTLRPVIKISKSEPALEGAGVHLRRAFGFNATEMTDPFLLLDDFRGDSPEMYEKGFPWHPHRGIETITYVLRGTVAHGDSLGNSGVIGPGDVQWMTAGSGIIHQEMPSGDPEGKMYGFQLWANLPRSEKMTDPNYQGVIESEIPRLQLPDGVIVRVICGTYSGVAGPIRDVAIQPEYLDVTIPSGITFTYSVNPEHTLLAYVFEGSGIFDLEQKVSADNHSLLIFGPGDEVQIIGGSEPLRFLLISGKPLHEPVAWYGPIVMNTHEEIKTAIKELSNGTFIKFH